MSEPPTPPSKAAPPRIRRLLGLALALSLAILAFIGASDAWVRHAAAPFLFRDLSGVPARPAAIVFGALANADGTPSPVLAARVEAAAALYHAGKVRKLLMTGDNGRSGYDEPTAMKRYAMQLGVPARDVIRDYAGFRTYDSCYRARRIFGVEAAVLVTQQYHLPRALFTARRLGIDAVGYAAVPGAPPVMLRGWRQRERLASAAAVLDVYLLHRRPRFLGVPEPLFRDEREDR